MNQLTQFIYNHWQLSLAFFLLLILTLINELLSKKKGAKELSPHAVVDLMNNQDAVIIDIRDKETFKKGHIINAVNMNADDLSSAKMDRYKNKVVILICARGLQAATLATKIRAQGFNAMTLKGGIASWQSTDLPLVKK